MSSTLPATINGYCRQKCRCVTARTKSSAWSASPAILPSAEGGLVARWAGQILEMIALSDPLEDVLEHLMRLVESQLTGIFGSVLLLEDDGPGCGTEQRRASRTPI